MPAIFHRVFSKQAERVGSIDKHNSLDERKALNKCHIVWQLNRLIVIFMLISSICGGVLAILPVKVLDKQLTWPELQTQYQNTASVSAPLSAMTPQDLSIDIPEASLLAHNNGYFLSTIPQNSSLLNTAGLVINSSGDHIAVVSRGVQVFDIQVKDLLKYPSSLLHIDTHNCGIYVELTHSPWNSFNYAQSHNQIFGPELKPQVAGIFTNLNNAELRGVHIRVHIDNRFDILPTFLKRIAIISSMLGFILALICLSLRQRIIEHKQLNFKQNFWIFWSGVRGIRLMSGIFSRTRIVDLFVIVALFLWWILGPGSAGDGVIYSEALNSQGHDTYIEYYRYFGISLAPFTWYVHALGLWSMWSANPFLMRLPQCLIGILIWLLIHYKVVPKLGKTALHPLSLWSGAGVFVSLWMCVDSGMHPEPVIALGIILAWIFFEQASARKNLLQLCGGFLCIFLTLTTAVTGIVALAVVFAFSRPIVRLISEQYYQTYSMGNKLNGSLRSRNKILPFLLVITPVILTFICVWDIVFYHQTLAVLIEAIRVKLYIGPITPWTSEFLRYFFLADGADTSIALRIPFILFCLFLVMSFYLLVRQQAYNSLILPMVMRIVSIVFLSAIFLSFTPNKWLDEFGAITSFAAVITIIGVELATRPTRMTARNVLVFLTAVIFCLSYACAAKNTWPNYANLGIPWFNVKPFLWKKSFTDWGLYITIIVAFLALLAHYRMVLARQTDARRGRSMRLTPHTAQNSSHILQSCIALPITIVLIGLVLFNLGIFAKAALSRAATYSMAKSNFSNFLGQRCALGEYIMLEPRPNDDILQPYGSISQSQALSGDDPTNTGFSPNGIPRYLMDLPSIITQGHSYTAVSGQSIYASQGQYPGTEGGITTAGINGSLAKLPFGLDNQKVPLLGSYNFPSTARLTTQWYRLPAYSPQRPVLAIAMAGAIQSWDKYGQFHYGQRVTIEFAAMHNGQVHALGIMNPIDAALGSAWRDIRVDLSKEKNANLVRIHIVDTNLRNDQWVAITPPRLPQLETIDALVGKQAKVLKDLAIAADFPCIHSVSNYGGVWQIPQWRIAPPRKEMDASSASWQKAADGGVLGIIMALDSQSTLPSYMKGDLYEDWGALIRLSPLVSSLPAQISARYVTQWGIDRSGPIRAFGGNDA